MSRPRNPGRIAAAAAAATLAAVLICGGNLPMAAGGQTTFYVSPAGNDNWSGKFASPTGRGDGPFATPARARDAIRTLKATALWHGPITVLVRGGEYFLDQPLVFTPQDSGSAQWPITYAGYPRDSYPVLSGGRRISGWKHLTAPLQGLAPAAEGNLWEADIPPRWHPEELTVNSGPMPRAAPPASPHWEQWLRAPASTDYELRISPQWFVAVANLSDLDLNVRTGSSTNLVLPIQRSNPEAAKLPKPGIFKIGQQYYYRLEDTAGGMLQPGNWYVSSSVGKIYFWPPKGIDPNRVLTVGANLTNALELKGGDGALVSHLNFDRLAIADVSRNRISQPAPSGRKLGPFDPGNTTDSAVLIDGASDCAFTHCRITGVAGAAFRLWLRARRINLSGNLISGCGANGISVFGYNPGTLREIRDNLISGNTIQSCGQTYWHSAGIGLAMAGETIVRGNHIASMPYARIMAGGQRVSFFRSLKGNNDYFRWNEIGETPLTVQNVTRFVPGNITIENNVIHDTMMIAQDGGGVYLWAEHNCVVRGNVVYRTGQDFSYGIYLDQDTLDSIVTNNLVYQCPLPSPARYGAAFIMNMGGRNTIVNNIFALRNRLFAFNGDRGGNIIEHNIFFFGPSIAPVQRPRPSADELAGGPSAMDHNLYWSTAGSLPVAQWLAGWRRQGWDQHSIAADPLFVDAVHSNFALRPNSPAAGIGFKPFSGASR